MSDYRVLENEALREQLAALAEENAKLKAIANLPAAGDERWEKLRAFIEIYRPSCGDTEYAVALQNACDAIENELDRLSPPQQEAGDEPGKCGTDYKAPGKRTGKTTIERVVSPC